MDRIKSVLRVRCAGRTLMVAPFARALLERVADITFLRHFITMTNPWVLISIHTRIAEAFQKLYPYVGLGGLNFWGLASFG